MQRSGWVHRRPENDVLDVISNQKTITTKRLARLVDPMVEKLQFQDEALEDNVKTIRALNDRAQRAETKLRQTEAKLQQAWNDLNRERAKVRRLETVDWQHWE